MGLSSFSSTEQSVSPKWYHRRPVPRASRGAKRRSAPAREDLASTVISVTVADTVSGVHLTSWQTARKPVALPPVVVSHPPRISNPLVGNRSAMPTECVRADVSSVRTSRRLANTPGRGYVAKRPTGCMMPVRAQMPSCQGRASAWTSVSAPTSWAETGVGLAAVARMIGTASSPWIISREHRERRSAGLARRDEGRIAALFARRATLSAAIQRGCSAARMPWEVCPRATVRTGRRDPGAVGPRVRCTSQFSSKSTDAVRT